MIPVAPAPISNAPNRWLQGASVGGYLLLLIIGGCLFGVIHEYGKVLQPTVDVSSSVVNTTGKSDPDMVLHHVLLMLLLILGLGRALGMVCQWCGQPRVIGEILAGMILGPSFLGRIAPGVTSQLLPDTYTDPQQLVIGSLSIIAQIGVILYMFLIGMELNFAHLRSQAYQTIIISHGSIVVQFLAASLLATWLYPILSYANVSFVSFTLFLGVSLSVTAFPILARIIQDHGLQSTKLGSLAFGCAAVDDITAWCVLAVIVSTLQGDGSQGLVTVAYTVAFVLGMFLIARPVMEHVLKEGRYASSSNSPLVLLLFGMILSAWISHNIGIHAIFGSFLFGLIIPRRANLVECATEVLKFPVHHLLLPAFFAFMGLRTDLGQLQSAQDWLICLAITLVAIAGKLSGATLAARCSGCDWRTAFAMGTLLNTRGLIGLIVLEIGYSMGVIPAKLFTMMVIMALSCTLLTAPLLRQILGRTEA